MKKLLFLTLMFASASSFAQSQKQSIMKRIQVGITAGGDYSDFMNADFDTEGLPGFHAGLILGFKINDKLSVQEEILFSQQGAKLKGDFLGKQDLKLYYTSIPILLKYRTSSGFYVEAGPQASFKIKEDVVGITDGDFAEKLDFGAAGGLGFQSKSGFGIGARYVYGFSPVGAFKSSVVKKDFTNATAQVSVFYIF
ncbi:porin family protein [Dyadobacter subterraneus]|uniref:PorT family protein n=1 Tax=Dyadobacter subterraneus TaxID=2773304 RepID=A0ABR9W922_9BACT|nr:porin family protein [Dyadobacter subterraneus]MBE9461985.1 PorT family protein [Dyadobacter subterraneus]